MEFEGQLLGIFLSAAVLIAFLSVFCWIQFIRLVGRRGSIFGSASGETSIGFVDLIACFFIWAGSQVVAGVFIALADPTIVQTATKSVGQLQTLMFGSGLAQLGSVALMMGYFLFRYGTWSARRYDATATADHLKQAGIAFLMVLPILLTLQWLLSKIIPYEHPTLETLAKDGSFWTITACWFGAVLAAPICEEYFFRGVLQNWLQRLRPGALSENWILLGGKSPNVQAGGLLSGESEQAAETMPADAGDSNQRNPYRAPSLSPGLDLTGRAQKSDIPIWPTLVTSVLFGLAHAGQGLAPIPLFLFSLFLGYLYRRTQSLIPCIVLHFLLNAYSMFWFTLGSVLS